MQIIECQMVCESCHGNRAAHWMANHWRLHCCVGDHSLKPSDNCETFKCPRFVERSEKKVSYTLAPGRRQRLWEQTVGLARETQRLKED